MWDVYALSSSTAAPSTLSSVTSSMPASRMDNLLTSNLWGHGAEHFVTSKLKAAKTSNTEYSNMVWVNLKGTDILSSKVQVAAVDLLSTPLAGGYSEESGASTWEGTHWLDKRVFFWSSSHADACTFFFCQDFALEVGLKAWNWCALLRSPWSASWWIRAPLENGLWRAFQVQSLAEWQIPSFRGKCLEDDFSFTVIFLHSLGSVLTPDPLHHYSRDFFWYVCKIIYMRNNSIRKRLHLFCLCKFNIWLPIHPTLFLPSEVMNCPFRMPSWWHAPLDIP